MTEEKNRFTHPSPEDRPTETKRRQDGSIEAIEGLFIDFARRPVGDRLPVGVLDAERLLKFADGPGSREAAGRHRSHTRVIAELSGFLVLIHILVRPER
jgi:hypothetical protein